MRELPDGYALRLPDEDRMLFKIADFIHDDRLCCPFFHFGLEVEPFGQGIWLTLRGGENIKPFILAELGHFLNDPVAAAVGLR